MAEKTIKGFIIKAILGGIQKRYGEEIIRKIKEDYGPLNFQSFIDYPEQENILLNQSICKVLFGDSSPENQRKLGELVFNITMDNTIGVVVMSQIGTLSKKGGSGLKVFEDIFQKVSSGLNISVTNITKHGATINFNNHGFPMEYMQGFFDGAIKKYKEIHTEEVLQPGFEWIKKDDKNYYVNLIFPEES